jgi:hypothetical protein
LWSTFNALVDHGRKPVIDTIDATVFHELFDRKVAAVRDCKVGAEPPTYRSVVTANGVRSLAFLSLM